MNKEMKQHEDYYFHISKESVNILFWGIFLIFIVVLMAYSGYVQGWENGYEQEQIDEKVIYDLEKLKIGVSSGDKFHLGLYGQPANYMYQCKSIGRYD